MEKNIEYVRLEYHPTWTYKFHFAELDEPFNKFGWEVLIDKISYENALEFTNYAINELEVGKSINDIGDTKKYTYSEMRNELNKFLLKEPIIYGK